MTNKKLKLAAMSVALTACVAAQPLVAHAVDAPADPEGKDADPKAALEEGADLKGQEENAPEGKDQVEAPVNQEADKKEQDPAFAPAPKPMISSLTINLLRSRKSPANPVRTAKPTALRAPARRTRLRTPTAPM